MRTNMTSVSATPRRASKGEPNPVDVWFGQRIRHARTMAGMSMQTLGDASGITFQQIQKYEGGKNRVTVSRLVDIARALATTPADLLAGMPEVIAGQSPAKLGAAAPSVAVEDDPNLRRRTLEIARMIGGLSEAAAADAYHILGTFCRRVAEIEGERRKAAE